MSNKLQCQECGRAEYGEDLYNYDGELLCRYCIVARVYEGSIPCEYAGTCNDKTYPNKTEQIDQLKQQLAEKDKEINSLIVDYEKRISQEQELMSNMEHRLTEKQNTIDEINKEFVQVIHDWKVLCDEKDKKLQEVMSNIVGLVRGRELIILDKIERFIDNEIEIPNDIGAIKLTQFFEEEIQRIKTGETYINWKQSQIQLAIAELEKVKELLLDEYKKYPIVYDKTNDIVAGALDRDKVNEIIDQQIKELRG